MRDGAVRKLTHAAVIAALYAAVTLLAAPISFGTLQCRVSEALCVLPWLLPEASWGLFAGCLLSNLLSGAGPLDVVFGSLATLLAALLTRRCPRKWLAGLPPVLLNALIVGAVLAYSTVPERPLPAFLLFSGQIALGEAAAVYLLGLPLLSFFAKKLRFTR